MKEASGTGKTHSMLLYWHAECLIIWLYRSWLWWTVQIRPHWAKHCPWLHSRSCFQTLIRAVCACSRMDFGSFCLCTVTLVEMSIFERLFYKHCVCPVWLSFHFILYSRDIYEYGNMCLEVLNFRTNKNLPNKTCEDREWTGKERTTHLNGGKDTSHTERMC